MAHSLDMFPQPSSHSHPGSQLGADSKELAKLMLSLLFSSCIVLSSSRSVREDDAAMTDKSDVTIVVYLTGWGIKGGKDGQTLEGCSRLYRHRSLQIKFNTF